jgi:chemotaxis protein CheX
MDVKYINPFINALDHTMATMLGVAPERMTISVKSHNIALGDISAIIGFAGENVQGSIALSFPEKMALLLYRRIIGEVVTRINKDIEDIVGELANIVAGGAKTELENSRLFIHNAIPSVIVGKNHTIAHKGTTPFVLIPFQWETHYFTMEVSMKIESTGLLFKRALAARAT